MAKGIGRLVQAGIARETTRGTVEAAASFWIPWSDLQLDEKRSFVQDEQSRGVIEGSVGNSIVKRWAEGVLKAPIADRHFPLILYSLLGSLSTGDNADSDASVKDHTITVLQSAQHPLLSLFIDDPLGGQDYKHASGAVTGLEISYEQGKFIEYTANLRAKIGQTATLTPSATTENRFLPAHVTFKLASDLSGLGAASATVLKSLRLKINQNVEDDDVLGSNQPADFLNKQFTIEGTVEALWQNESDFKTAFLAGTAKAMRIDLVNTDVTIGAAANPQLRIDLAKVIFEELGRPLKLNDLVMQTLTFKAHYSTADSKMITVLATNITASY